MGGALVGNWAAILGLVPFARMNVYEHESGDDGSGWVRLVI